jgi:hypothetical protein
VSQPFPAPSIPTPKIPPEVATIGSLLFGMLMTVLTATGVTPANANAIVAALQFVLYAGFAVAGVLGQLHVHAKHVEAIAAAGAFAVPPPPPTSAPLIPSYVPPDASTAGMLTISTPSSTTGVPAPTQTASGAPQPPPVDTPVQVVPVVADAPPAPAQDATDASAT